MKKIIILLSLTVVVAMPMSYAQKKTKTPATSAVITSNDSVLYQQWRLVSWEEFGTENQPSDTQKNDAITFTKNGAVVLTREGKTQTGTFTLDKTHTTIFLNLLEPKEQLRFKLIKTAATQLKYEYQQPNLIRTIYQYEAAKMK